VVEAFRKSVRTIQSFVLLDAVPQAEWMAPQNYDDLLADAEPYRRDVMEVDENSMAELFYTSGTSASTANNGG